MIPQTERFHQKSDRALGVSHPGRLSSEKRPEHSNTGRPGHDSGPQNGAKHDGVSVRLNQQAESNTTEHPNTCDEISQLVEVQQLLADPRLLHRIEEVIQARGYAGEVGPAMLAYFALTSRLLPERPINLAIVSPSSAGKNKTVDSARELVPADAVHFFSAGSQKALIYSSEDFKNRVVIFAEADSIPDEGPAASFVRALFEDSRVVYEVVEKGKDGGIETRRIEKQGPTGLITTSTKTLARQINTRALEVWIDDSPDQTREVVRAHARAVMPGAALSRPSVTLFVEVQRWLAEHGDRRVVVPFAGQLAELVPVHEVRIRRDFKQLISVIQTSALLHQQQRERTESGEIVATLDDYAHARRLLSRIFDAITDDSVTPAIRETVEAVVPGEVVSQSDLVARLGRSKAAISERVRKAVAGGWLVRVGDKGRAAEVRRGEPLPETDTALPTVEAVRKRSGVRLVKGHSNSHPNTRNGLLLA